LACWIISIFYRHNVMKINNFLVWPEEGKTVTRRKEKGNV
jgi:hypothetical protein